MFKHDTAIVCSGVTFDLIFMGYGTLIANLLNHKINQNCTETDSDSHRAVNTLRLGYKNQSVNVV
jgi:hypothetical protein